MSFTRGRQIRRFGKVLLPPLAPSPSTCDWTACELPGALADDGTRAALAAQWRENGRTEHASVAAFARLTLDLVALGAPPSLVADAQPDALDEIHHAELCFALARAIAVLPDAMHTVLPEAAAAGGWERWGIMGSALEAAEYARARASVAALVAPYGLALAA